MTEQWWFWGLVGAGVAGVAVAAVLLAQPDDPQLMSGDVGGRIVALEVGP